MTENKKNKINLHHRKFFSVLFSLFGFVFISSFSATNSLYPPDIKDTIIVYDSVWQNDTLYIYETLHITVSVETTDSLENINEDSLQAEENFENNFVQEDDVVERDFLHPTNYFNPQIDKKSDKFLSLQDFSVGYEFMPVNFSVYNYSTASNSNFNDLLNNSLTPKFAYSTGFFAEIDKNNFAIQSGMYHTQFWERFYMIDEFTNIDTLININILQTTKWQVDTVYFLNLDSLLQGDTVWIPYFDSTKINYVDTNIVTTFDTTNTVYEYYSKNRYTYFEVPLIFSYNFNFQRFNIGLQAGVIASFLIQNRGLMFGNDGLVLLQKQIPRTKIFVSPYISFKAGYKITDNLSVYVSPFYRFPMQNFYSEELIFRKMSAYGAKFGIQYYF